MKNKPKILSGFLFRRFMTGFGVVLLVISGVIFAITFVEQLPGAGSVPAALAESYSRLLEYIPLFLPLVVFMGTLFTSYNLTKSSENIIISTAGLSPYQSMKPFLWGAVILGLVSSLALNPYSVHLANRNIGTEKLSLIDGAVWLRENTNDGGALTVRALGMSRKDNAIVFKDVIMLVQDQTQKISSRIEAAALELSDTGFSSDKADIYESNGAYEKNAKWGMESALTPQAVLDRYLKPDQVSFWRMPQFMREMGHIGLNIRPHLVQFWTLLFMPLTLMAMVVLGVAFSQTHERRNYSFSVKFGIGIVACFALYFIMNVFSAIGSGGGLPTILAVLAPPLIIIAGAATFIVTFDTI